MDEQEQEIERYNQLAQARAAERISFEKELERLHRVINKIKDIFHKEGESFEDKDLKALSKGTPEKPTFPIIMLSVAIIKDITDLPQEISVIGTIPGFFLSVLATIILFFWLWNKMSGKWWKKPMISALWTVFIGGSFVECTPFLRVIPAETIIVLMAYYREKKTVRLLNLALEELHAAGF